MPANIQFDGGVVLAFAVKNLEQSIAWYRDVLGMSYLYTKDDIGWAELQSNTANVRIGLSEVETFKQGGGAVPTFGVQDIDAAQKHLKAHNVRIDGAIQEIPGLVRLLTFFDPDGNALMLYQDMRKI